MWGKKDNIINLKNNGFAFIEHLLCAMCYTSDNIQNVKRDNIYLFSNLLYTVLLKYVKSGDTDDH